MSYLQSALADAGTVEIRHIEKASGSTVIKSGLFDQYEPMVQAIYSLYGHGNLFTTLNATNVPATNTMGSQALKDSDITRIKRLPFDFDPARASGSASTDDQLDEARQAALFMSEFLGWGEPLIGMSGNGYHLQYRCDLPATDEVKAMLTMMYRGFSQDFGTCTVHFDSTVRNPSRIFRLYGSINRKSSDVQRKTSCVVPGDWGLVSHDQIREFAEGYRPKLVGQSGFDSGKGRSVAGNYGRGNYNHLDIVAWFTAHGLYEHHIERNMHSVVCPWESEHSEASHNDSIVFEGDGSWPGFHCKHSHCDGRTVKDVMTVFGDADMYCQRVA